MVILVDEKMNQIQKFMFGNHSKKLIFRDKFLVI